MSEDRYRTVVDDLTEVICRFLPDGTITFVNDVYCRKFGKSPSELVGHRWHPLAYAGDVPLIEAKIREMSRDNPVVIIENRVYGAGGELHWMQFVNRGFYGADGSIIEIQSVGRDITSLKQVEDALRESEANLERAQSVASIGSFAFGTDTNHFTYTRETARLFDLNEQGHTTFEEWFSRVCAEDRPTVDAAWRAALQGAPYDITYRIVARGQMIWIRALAKLTFDEMGRPLSGVGTVQDISRERQIEIALRKSEERLEMALAGSGLALWDWDIQAHEIAAGARLGEMLGRSSEELGRREDDWLRLIHPRDRDQLQQTIITHLKGDTPTYQGTHRLRHKEGHWVTVEARGKVTQRDQHGAPLRMVGTVLDVSQRKRLNEEGVDLLRQIEKLIRESTASSSAAQEGDALESLTKRERQILVMIARGMTSSQIAGQLNIATNTVISHRHKMMSKLELHSTAEVIRFAVDHHLLARSA